MKILDEDDLKILDNLDCFDKITYYITVDHFGQPMPPYIYGYQLCNLVLGKRYKKTDSYLKKCFLSLFPDKLIQVPTPYIFMVNDINDRYWWSRAMESQAYLFYSNRSVEIAFEEVFENVSEDLKEKLIYHLDIFAIK